MWLSFLIVPLTLLFDSKWNLRFLGLGWPTQFSFIFLVFLCIKRPLRETIWSMLLFALLAHSQGQMSLSEILVPYFILLVIVSYAKKRIEADTYLFEAIWAMGLFFVFLCLQHLFYDYETFFSFRFYKSYKLMIYLAVHGVLAFMAFIFLDWVYDNLFERKKNY